MKKLLLALGSATAIAAPITAVVVAKNFEVNPTITTEYNLETNTVTVKGFKLDESNPEKGYEELFEVLSTKEFVGATNIVLEGYLDSSEDARELTSILIDGEKSENLGELLSKEGDKENIGKLLYQEATLPEFIQIGGEDYTPENGDDEFIMVGDYYLDGELWRGDNKNGNIAGPVGDDGVVTDKDDYVALIQEPGWGADQGVAEMADGDSIIVVYDDTHGDTGDLENVTFEPNPYNFDRTVAFVDTSMKADQAIIDINTELGHGVHKLPFVGDVSLPMFKNMVLQPYIGGQSNHMPADMTFQDAMKIIEDNPAYDEHALEAVLRYYGYLLQKDANGDFIKDPNNQGASTAFLPVVGHEGLLTAEKIALNAIKITYNNDDPTWGLPAASIGFASELNPVSNYFDVTSWGRFSFGKNSWDVYEGHNTDYTFTARKDIYINS